MMARIVSRAALLIARVGAPRATRVRALATRAELAAQKAALSAPLDPARLSALFSQIERGLAGMAADNNGFRVERLGDAAGVRVHTARGVFELTANAAGTVTFSSPKVGHSGGAHDYRWSERAGHWASTSDGHFLLELLTRDLIHAVPGGLRGMPTF